MIVSFLSPAEVQTDLAKKFRLRRRHLGHSRDAAAEASGVPAPTIRRFEKTGELSLRQFIMLCHVYGDLAHVTEALKEPEARSIQELIEKKGRSPCIQLPLGRRPARPK